MTANSPQLSSLIANNSFRDFCNDYLNDGLYALYTLIYDDRVEFMIQDKIDHEKFLKESPQPYKIYQSWLKSNDKSKFNPVIEKIIKESFRFVKFEKTSPLTYNYGHTFYDKYRLKEMFEDPYGLRCKDKLRSDDNHIRTKYF